MNIDDNFPLNFYLTKLKPNYQEISKIINIPRSKEADILLLAISGQESNWEHRYQISSIKGRKGPARGFWQFEKGGGVAGVMTHPESKNAAKRLVDYLVLPWDKKILWEQLEYNDKLAVGFARLLLWTDPKTLPTNTKAGWNYYYRNWRPGKPHPSKWPKIWIESIKTIENNYE
jgi:hypothetical protein